MNVTPTTGVTGDEEQPARSGATADGEPVADTSAGGADGGEADGQPSPRRWAVLAVLCASLLLAGIDLTVLHVAVPTLTRELLPSGNELLWIVDIYPLTVAALLVTFGTLADRIGRKRLVLAGLLVFGLASVGAALSGGPLQLIAARGGLGVGAAMFMAATVAIIRQVFTDRRERALALGLWTAANSVGAAVGPALGGVLLERWWWGAIFLVNVPVVLIAVAAGAWIIPESRDPVRRRWDALSAVVSIVGLFALVFALKRTAEETSMDPVGLGLAAAGLALLAVFVRRQRRIRHPLLDLSLFSDRRFSVATLCVLVCFGCYAALLFFASQLLQLVAGNSPVASGVALVPLAVASGVGAVVAPWLSGRYGHRWVTVGALLGFACGFTGLAAVSTRLDADAAGTLVGLAPLLAGLVLSGLGAGMVMTMGADAIMSTARPDRAGAAGAIQETSFELGAGVGIAVLGTVLTVTYRLGLPSFSELSGEEESQVRESLGAATEVAPETGPHAQQVLDAAQRAFTQGFAAASVAAAGALVVTAVLTGLLLRPRNGR